jgi:lipoyl-dependent peroxiredoxin
VVGVLSVGGQDRRACRVNLPPEVAIDAEVDLGLTNGSHFIQARLNVSLPGVEREVAQKIVDAAHRQCPYSKATHGNVNVVTTVNTQPAAQVA